MNGREQFKRAKPIIKALVFFISLFPKGARKKLLVWNRGVAGRIGNLIRYVLLKSILPTIGENIAIDQGVILLNIDKLKLGSNISINPNCYIDALGGVEIGNNVSIATETVIISSSHTWGNDSIPIKYNPVENKPVVIHDDVWIACGVRVIGECTINSRSIVAAGAVVKGEVPTHSIVGGVPAKVIKRI